LEIPVRFIHRFLSFRLRIRLRIQFLDRLAKARLRCVSARRPWADSGFPGHFAHQRRELAGDIQILGNVSRSRELTEVPECAGILPLNR